MKMDPGTELFVLGRGLWEPAGGGGRRTACVGAEKTSSAFKSSEENPTDVSVMNQCQAVHSFL